MRRLAFSALFAALVGAPLLPAQGVRISMHAWPEPVLLDTMRQEHKLSAQPDRVYEAVQKAFGELGIPGGGTDSRAGIIASERFERTHNLAGAPMSRSFDCGIGATGPYADSFRLEIAVVAWVKPGANGGTTLGLATIASGSDITGVFRKPKECASTGALETRLLDRVSKILAP